MAFPWITPAGVSATFLQSTLAGGVINVPAPGSSSATINRVTIQAALNGASPGDTVRLAAGEIYEVNSAGSMTFASAGGLVAYCIKIPTGVTLDTNGSRLRLAAGTIAILVCNANPNATTDTNIGLIGGGVCDGNGNDLYQKGLTRFEGVTGFNVDYRMYNAGHVGIFLLNCTTVRGSLIADTIQGIALYLGSPTYKNTDCRFTLLQATNVTADPNNTFNFPGNPVYANLIDSNVDLTIVAQNTGGAKIDGCINTHFAVVEIGPGGDGSGNSGCKLQSASAGFPLRTTVGTLRATGQVGPGLYIDPNAVDCGVASYIGEGNDILGTYTDVWIDGTRTTVQSIRSTEAGGSGLTVRATAADYRLGKVRIRNNGNTAAAATKFAASVASGSSGVIDEYSAVDDQGTPTMVRGMDIAATAILHVGKAEIHGQTSVAITTASYSATFGPVRYHATDPMNGEILLTAAAVTTAIANGNFQVHGVGPAAEPEVKIQAINAAAVALGVRPTFTAGTMTLKHAAAVGTERYRWQIVGWQRTPTAAA